MESKSCGVGGESLSDTSLIHFFPQSCVCVCVWKGTGRLFCGLFRFHKTIKK